MSSLAAARADNFYNPPDWDPSKISRDKYQGSKGSNQYEQRGEIRFEMPWNIWCATCDSHIGRGVRYNAKKNHIGNYFSTKIWEFSMKCHICKGIIKICTDPQNCDYKVTKGGKRRCMTYSVDDLELIDIKNDLHKQKMETDAIYNLQHQEIDKKNKLQNALRLQSLYTLQERDKNDYDNNCNLRKKFREKKKKKLTLQKHADTKGIAINLLEFNKDDEIKANKMKFKNKNKNKVSLSAKKKMKMKRIKLENESIFKGQYKGNNSNSNSKIKVDVNKSRKLLRRSKSHNSSLHSKTKFGKSKSAKSLLNHKIKCKQEKKLLLLNKMKNAKRCKSGGGAFSVDLKSNKFYRQ